MKPIVLAVDGFAATGKSTTARKVAHRLGYTFIDTGAMYRAVALYLLRNDVAIDPENSGLEAALNQIELEFRFNAESDARDMFLNGENVEMEIRSLEVSSVVSEVAALSAVRRRLVALQQEMGKGGGIVMDGRDIGTVVFPNADLKVFLTAQMDIRVERRMQELSRKGKPANPAEVRKNLMHRDHIDSTRADSPLRKAEDAIEIDTTELTIPLQVDKVVAMAQKILAELV